MLTLLILLFVTVPLAELALLIWVGGKVGVGATVALVIVTGILGASLARWQGLATLSRFQSRLAAGELPHQDLIDGILILVAGAVLLTPGLITDTVGFLLLVPAVRAAIRGWLARRFAARLVVGPPVGPRTGAGVGAGATGAPPRRRPPAAGDIVDAEYEVKE